jgi:sugar lactone lactonase YvrE
MSFKEPAEADMHTLVSDLMICESPRWHDGQLWLADWGAKEVIAVERDGRSEVVVRGLPWFPFSLDWLPDGRLLIICERRLLRKEEDGALVTHVDLAGISDYGWNEIVVDGRGNIYLNNPDFDLMSGKAPKPGFIGLLACDDVRGRFHRRTRRFDGLGRRAVERRRPGSS